MVSVAERLYKKIYMYVIWPVNVVASAGVRDLAKDPVALIDPPARIASLLCFVHASTHVWPYVACVCFLCL